MNKQIANEKDAQNNTGTAVEYDLFVVRTKI